MSTTYDEPFAASAEALIRARRSKRAFLPDPVPRGTLEKIFELANQAPSSSNTQVRRVEVVSGGTRDRLSRALVAAAQAGQETLDFPLDTSYYHGPYQERMQQFGSGLYGTWGIGRDDAEGRRAKHLENLEFYGAPHAAFLFVPDFMVERQSSDVGIYGQTLMLAMKGYGVDSCAQAILALYADTVRDCLKVDPHYKLLWGLSFGYADPEAPINAFRSTRVPVGETVHFHG